ncbi:MAG: anthranilate synthase component I [Myxococcota bacterium]
MVCPDRETFRALARHGRAVLLAREVLADLDTPLAIFRKLDDGQTSFLFESVEGGERWGRYSFIGVGARARLIAQGGSLEVHRGDRVERHSVPETPEGDPLNHLRRLLRTLAPIETGTLPRFAGGAVGYLSYDWVRHVERLPAENPDPLGLPSCFFTFPEVVLVHDRKRQRLTILLAVEPQASEQVDAVYDDGVARIEAVLQSLARPVPPLPAAPGVLEPPEITSTFTREAYHEVVKRAREYIQAGDVFQVVPSQRLTIPLRTDPFLIYRWLRATNPSPYLFFLRAPDHLVIGSSPEILVRLEGREITLRPIAGTRPRGEDAEEDRRREEELLADPKELAEHVMLVDLGRNDVGRVAEIGSVRVDEFQGIERYSHVIHIVSNVRGRLRPEHDAIDLLRATFPAGTLTGAPKVRAMEIIEELEPVRRGVYGGAVGYIDYRGDMDVCIAIRTIVIKGESIYLQAGGGVVADSDPETEYLESLQKAEALRAAIELAERGTEG